MNYEEQQEYQERMGSPEMEYLQYQVEQNNPPREQSKKYALAVRNGSDYSIELFATLKEAVMAQRYTDDYYIMKVINDFDIVIAEVDDNNL